MAALTPEQRLLGYYLAADVVHDFDGDVLATARYNYGGPTVNATIPKSPIFSEDVAVTYIEAARKPDGTEFIEFGEERRKKRIIFTIPTKTSTFNASSLPVLVPGGNTSMGIVHDAGKFITRELGGKHVLTFGSILDPAGKPIQRASEPIWFKPTDAENTAGIEIQLDSFGFDPTRIEKIKVFNLTAGTVSSLFSAGGKVFDAITMETPPKVPYGRKPINDVRIEKAGFYTSIEKASDLVSSVDAQKVLQSDRYLFNVGKTLGDLTLVASCMPSFSSGVSNVYHGIGKRGWLDWISGEEVASPPSILVLKTGDRLNALRAQMENVPVILEQQVGRGRTVKQFVFTPGKIVGEEIINAVRLGYAYLITNVTSRYDTLIANFNRCLQSGPTGLSQLNPMYAIFTETPVINPRDQNGLFAAGSLINEIANYYLPKIRDKVVEWLDARITRLGEYAAATEADKPRLLEEIQTRYNQDSEICTRVAPQTTDVFYVKGGVTKMSLKIVVSQLPKTIQPGFDCPVNSSLDISLWNAFSKLSGKDPSKLDVLAGTDFYKRFFVPVSVFLRPRQPLLGLDTLRGGMKGGVIEDLQAEEDALLREFVNYTTSKIDPRIEGSQTGGVVITIDHKNLDSQYPKVEQFAETFPLLAEFHDYIARTLGIRDRYGFLFACYDLLLNGSGVVTIIDDVLLGEIMKEINRLTAENPETLEAFVTFSGGQPYIGGRSTPGTAAFNAFTCHINAMNSAEFGYIANIPEIPDKTTEPITIFKDEAELVSSVGVTFRKLEYLYLNNARAGILATRTSSVFKPATAFSPTKKTRKAVKLTSIVGKSDDKRAEALAELIRNKREMLRKQGGLRPRRPLYSNAPIADSLPLLTDDDSGLRKRSRTRRTRRVR